MILYTMICLKIPTRTLGIIRQKRLAPTAAVLSRVNYNLPQSQVDIDSDDKVDVDHNVDDKVTLTHLIRLSRREKMAIDHEQCT